MGGAYRCELVDGVAWVYFYSAADAWKAMDKFNGGGLNGQFWLRAKGAAAHCN